MLLTPLNGQIGERWRFVGIVEMRRTGNWPADCFTAQEFAICIVNARQAKA
ncbi:hypothetical protein [Bradyrhizobium sp. Rc3b]|uniref:hypothetical protein n=1 Tax=Bradyrhizobium sp. Rc3b TaxID=1855322 RepID=UPI0015A6FB5D|nr:hypothetical protein [Bradyrhizobium sp. Rc3b]